MRLRDLLSGAKPSFMSGDSDIEIEHLALDSRRVRPSSLFFALPGARTDGNRFVREAVANGALAVMSELKPPPAPMTLVRPGAPDKTICWLQVDDVLTAMSRAAANFYGDPSTGMIVAGITGTNGKTTTAYFLESIFSRAGGVCGVVGTISHRLACRELERAVNTTPFSLDLIRLLARMRAGGATHAALEVSSHALATRRVEDVHFDAAVLTNLRSDHMDFHKTAEAYFSAKARLFELLERPDAVKKRRLAVLNRDDATYARLRARAMDVRMVSYGRSREADYSGDGVDCGLAGSVFRIRREDEERPVRIRLIGEHNVHNALAAAAAARELGASWEAVVEGLAAVDKISGRLEPVEAGQDFSVLVDYAHTEDALASVLDSILRLPHRRVITVFGCGGDRDKSKRRPMGAAACGRSDLVIATSDNPRNEDPMEILREIEDGMRSAGRDNYKIVPGREEAIFEAVRAAQKGDIVLVAGKGHERRQALKGRSVPFDDREAATAAMKDLGRI